VRGTLTLNNTYHIISTYVFVSININSKSQHLFIRYVCTIMGRKSYLKVAESEICT